MRGSHRRSSRMDSCRNNLGFGLLRLVAAGRCTLLSFRCVPASRHGPISRPRTRSIFWNGFDLTLGWTRGRCAPPGGLRRVLGMTNDELDDEGRRGTRSQSSPWLDGHHRLFILILLPRPPPRLRHFHPSLTPSPPLPCGSPRSSSHSPPPSQQPRRPRLDRTRSTPAPSPTRATSPSVSSAALASMTAASSAPPPAHDTTTGSSSRSYRTTHPSSSPSVPRRPSSTRTAPSTSTHMSMSRACARPRAVSSGGTKRECIQGGC